MVLTAHTNYKLSPHPALVEDFPCTSLTTKVGSLIGINETTGLAVLWTDADNQKLLGRCVKAIASGSSVTVFTGPHTIRGKTTENGVTCAGATTAANQGDLVYCSLDDMDNCTLTPGNEPIGRVMKVVTSGFAWVQLIPRGYSLGSPSSFEGAVDLASTLNVAGATTLETTLAVTGASTFTGATTHTAGIVDNGGTTTTRGIASGTALKVGGHASGTVVASTAITNTASETAFDNSSYAIPASTLTQGTRLKFFIQGIATGATGSITLEILLYLGATEVLSTAALDIVDNDVFTIVGELVARAAPGGTAACVAMAQIVFGTDEEVGVAGHAIMPETNFATNGALTMNVRAKMSAANTGMSVRLDICNYEVIG